MTIALSFVFVAALVAGVLVFWFGWIVGYESGYEFAVGALTKQEKP